MAHNCNANDLIQSVNFIPTAKFNSVKICNDKLTILPVKNVEPSIFLVDGYIRKQTFKINILPEINKLIYSFYQKMNGTSIVWEINNIDTLLNNINQDEFKSIESNVYPIHTSFQQLSKSQLFLNTSPFKFYLKINFDNGRFKLYIVLVSMPSILDHIHFIYQLYCNELNNYWSSSDHLFYKDSLCKLLNNDTSNHLASTSNNSNNSNPDVTINDIKSLNINSLTFYCSLDILNINIGDKHKYNLSYYYNSRLEKNHLLFDGQLSNNFEMKYDEFKFQWNINNHILNDLKSVNINKMNNILLVCGIKGGPVVLFDENKISIMVSTNDHFSTSTQINHGPDTDWKIGIASTVKVSKKYHLHLNMKLLLLLVMV